MEAFLAELSVACAIVEELEPDPATWSHPDSSEALMRDGSKCVKMGDHER
jgi:hypothetical protein